MERPSTPPFAGLAGEKKTLQNVLLHLDETYNLGLSSQPAPHGRQLRSRPHENEESDRAAAIITKLRYHVQSRNGEIDKVLHDLDARARLVGSKWVPKPLADSNTTPRQSKPPRAITAEERRDLQDALLYVLEERSPTKRGALVASFATEKLPSPPDRLRAKRLSGELIEAAPAKRTRSTQHLSPAVSLDRVPVREKFSLPGDIVAWRQSVANGETERKSIDVGIPLPPPLDTSKNSSKTSLESYMFGTPVHVPGDSQTTYAFSSQEVVTEKLASMVLRSPTSPTAGGEPSRVHPTYSFGSTSGDPVQLNWRESHCLKMS